MILKEKIFIVQSDPLLKAGDEAEKQMAFYLGREFEKANDIFVINDLRISHEGEFAQIDHLLVTKYGLFVIESKSVHGTVSFNQYGDWVRISKGGRQGMPSPIKQAEAQGKVVKELIRANAKKLLGTLLGMQKGFAYCPIEIRVAISDSGIIDRGYDETRVLKADMVSESISRQLREMKSALNLFSSKLDSGWVMKLEEAKRVAKFLLENHQPKNKQKTEIKESSFQTETFIPRVGAICPKCNQFSLERGSIKRSDGTETDYLRCTGYPHVCDAIFPLVAMSATGKTQVGVIGNLPPARGSISNSQDMKEGDNCPQCNSGRLVFHTGKFSKPDFLGCSNFRGKPSCRFIKSLGNTE